MKKYASASIIATILLGSMSSILLTHVNATMSIAVGVTLANGMSYNLDNYGMVYLFNSTWGKTSSIVKGNASFFVDLGNYRYELYSAGAKVGNGSLQITSDKSYYEATADADFSFLHKLSRLYILNLQGSGAYSGAYIKLYRWCQQTNAYVLVGVDPNKTGPTNTYIKTDASGIANYTYQLRPSGYYKIEVCDSSTATSPIYTTNASLMDPTLGDIFLVHPKSIGIAATHSIPLNPIQVSPWWIKNNSVIFSDTMFASQGASMFYKANLVSSSGEIELEGAAGSDFDIYLLDQKGMVLAKSESTTYPYTISYQLNSLSNPYYIEVKNSKKITTRPEDNIFRLNITGKPDFNLEVTYASTWPWDQSLWYSGQSISYQVSVTSFCGFNVNVSLSLAGLPTDFLYNFYPQSLVPNSTSLLRITAPMIASDSNYQLIINGTGSGRKHSAYANLVVNFWIFSYYLPTQTQKMNSSTTRVTYGYFANFTYGGNAVNYWYPTGLWSVLTSFLSIGRVQYGASINVTVTLPIDVTIRSNSTYVRPGANVELNATMTAPKNQAQIKIGAYLYCEIIDTSNNTWMSCRWRYSGYPFPNINPSNFTAPLGTFRKELPIRVPLPGIGIPLIGSVNLALRFVPWLNITGMLFSKISSDKFAAVVSPSSGDLTWAKDNVTETVILHVSEELDEDRSLTLLLSPLEYSLTAVLGLDIALDLEVDFLLHLIQGTIPLITYSLPYTFTFPFATLATTIPVNSTAAKIDAVPPSVSSINLSNANPNPSDAVTLSCAVSDKTSGVKTVSLHYSTDDGKSWNSATMLSHSPEFTATIPPQVGGSIVQYYVTAEDIVGNVYRSAASQYVVKLFTTISPNALSLIQKRTSALAAVLRDERGTPLSGAAVVFYCLENGVWRTIGSVLTDANGNASISFTPIIAGESQIKIMYSGSLTYVESSSVSSVSIIPVYDLTINVKDLFGFGLSGTSIKLLENGRAVDSGVTDSEGSLTFTDVPEGQYQIEANFMGQTHVRSISLNESTTQFITIAISLFVIGAIVVPLGVVIAVAFWVTKKRRKITVKK